MKYKTYYWKVVRTTPTRGLFESAISISTNTLIYQVGEITRDKKGYGVFVFNTRKNARDFVLDFISLHLKILKVEVFGMPDPKNLLTRTSSMRFPEGTCLFPSVKPIEIAR